MKKTRRFKSKGWYGVGEDEGFDPMFNVEIVREMDVGPILFGTMGLLWKVVIKKLDCLRELWQTYPKWGSIND